MAKQVTVFGVEGGTLRGVRLDAAGEDFARASAEAWPLAAPAPPDDAAGDAALDADAPPPDAAVVEEDRPLARALRAAAVAFGTREVVLSLPLAKMLVRVVRLPVEAREDLLGAAQLELDGISPFPDEALTPGVEVVAETDKELVALVAALPEAASAEVGTALAAAKVHVLRTDATALGWLRGLWPQICARADAARRIVLLDLDGGWDLVILDNGAPTFLRGIGAVAGPAELGREVMLSLLALDGGRGDEVVVCARRAPDAALLERLADFGPVRTVLVEDDFAGVEGTARRAVEGAALDVTPAAWVEARTENRFRRRLFTGLAVAGGVWLALMGVLFGVDTAYDLLAGRQKALQRERRHAAAFREVADMTNRVALIERYADHAHGALEVLKTVSDCLPASEEMAFRTFQYRRGESVRVNGSAPEREDLRSFTERLEAATFDDGEETPVFAKVQQSGGETQTKKGVRFAIECFFHGEDEDANGRRGR